MSPEAGGLFLCPHCGARYAVTYMHRAERRADKAVCLVCARTMNEWDSTAQPNYTLVERPPPRKGH